MQLLLRPTRAPENASPATGNFGPGGGRIGRDTNCTLVLAAPVVSRLHAEIRHQDGAYFLKVLSKINPVVVNGIVIGCGQMIELAEGDAVELGEFGFVVEFQEEVFPLGANPPPLGAAMASDDPFRFLEDFQPRKTVTPPVADPFLQPQPGSSIQRVSPVPRAASSQSGLSDLVRTQVQTDSPLLGVLKGGLSSPGAQPLHAGAGTHPLPADESTIDRLLGGKGTALDTNLGAAHASESTLPGKDSLAAHSDHVADVNLPFSLPQSISRNANTQSMASQGQEDVFSTLDGLSSPFPAGDGAGEVPPTSTQASTPPGTQEPLQPPTLGSSVDQDGTAWLARFAEGVGMPLNAVDDPGEFLFELGRMFRIGVEGVHALLMLRAEVKKELRADERTMIASRENNPLKHTETLEEALAYLLDLKAQNPAFMPPVRAMQDAFDDMRAHELAVMAGMRAGLAGVIKHFSPERLETRIKKFGSLDKVVPALYKAKLWDNYVEFARMIESEAEDQFDKLFGREFVRAYMEQCKKLRN